MVITIFIIASIQVTEAIKILTGQFDQLHRSIIQIDIWQHTFNRIKPGHLLERAECSPASRASTSF